MRKSLKINLDDDSGRLPWKRDAEEEATAQEAESQARDVFLHRDWLQEPNPKREEGVAVTS